MKYADRTGTVDTVLPADNTLLFIRKTWIYASSPSARRDPSSPTQDADQCLP